MPAEHPTVSEIKAELSEFCRQYPAITRSGVRLVVSETQQELYDEIEELNPVTDPGRSGCAYLPGRSIISVVTGRNASDAALRRDNYAREILGRFAFYTFSRSERDQLTESLWASRERNGIREVWDSVQDLAQPFGLGRQDMAAEVWSQAMMDLGNQAGNEADHGEKVWTRIVTPEGTPALLDGHDLMALGAWVKQGMADGTRQLQSGLSVDAVKREVNNFVAQNPTLQDALYFVIADKQEELFDGKHTKEDAGRVGACYFPSRSTVGVSASSLYVESELQRGLSHECFGHFALLTLESGEKYRLLERIAGTRGQPEWTIAWQNVDKNYPKQSELGKAEEIYALLAEVVAEVNPDSIPEQRRQQARDAILHGDDPIIPQDVRDMAVQMTFEIKAGLRQQQIFPQEDHHQFQVRPDAELLKIIANDLGGYDLLLPPEQAVSGAARGASEQAESMARAALESLPDPRITRVAVPVQTLDVLGNWFYKPAQLLPDWEHHAGIAQGATENGRNNAGHVEGESAGGRDRPGTGFADRTLGGRPGDGNLPGAGVAGSLAELSGGADGSLGSPGSRLPGGRSDGHPAGGDGRLDSGMAAGADHPERTDSGTSGTDPRAEADLSAGQRDLRRAEQRGDDGTEGSPADAAVLRGTPDLADTAPGIPVGAAGPGTAGTRPQTLGGGDALAGAVESASGDRGPDVGRGLGAGIGADGAAAEPEGVSPPADFTQYPITRALAVLKNRMLDKAYPNYHREAAGQDQRGPKQKARDNIAAIRLIKQCGWEKRFPTEEERQQIALFYGFGGIPQAFPRPNGSIAEGWEDIVPALQAVTTPDEYASIRRSTLDAHYTADEVVSAMWAGVEKMGLRGILDSEQKPFRIWESSIGAGVFFALMPPSIMAEHPQIARSGVEMDALSASVSQVLFPQDKIINAPLQAVPLQRPVDLVIGNPPFGAQKLLDTHRKDLSRIAPNTHSYFFAKSLDALNPGGIAALVVSRYLLDANREENQQFRRWMHRNAELLHAVRLPRTAFHKTAFTEVVTDIIVLRKRAEPLPENTPDPDWIDGKVPLNATHEGKRIVANGWYANREHLILGTPSLVGKMYGGPDNEELTVLPLADVSLADLLAERFVAHLPENAFAQWQPLDKDRIDRPTLPVVDPEQVGRVQPYGYFVVPEAVVPELEKQFGKTQSGIQIARRLPDDYEGNFDYSLVDEKNSKHFLRMAGMIRLRDIAMELLEKQMDPDVTSAELDRLRAVMNREYDQFRKQLGCLNDPANNRLLRADPGSAIVMGLERDYDKGVSREMAQRTGEKARKPSAVKSDLFTKRTQYPVRPVDHADSAKDALFITLAEKGHIQWHRVLSLTGQDWETTAAELGLETPAALAFETVDGHWEERSAFLSGDVKSQLADVEQALQGELPDARRRSLQASREALESVVPKDIPAELITVHPGAPYIPTAMAQQFMSDLGIQDASATYLSYNGQWLLTGGAASGPVAEGFALAKRPLRKLVGDLFNHRTPIIYFPDDGDGKRQVDEESTALAIEKVKALREHWHKWLLEDPERMTVLAREYNDRFNRIVQREYDGRHLSLPGSAHQIKLRPHQKNAVWRACQSKSVLFDHKVGAGKTFAAIASVMEKRRMGQARKPIVTVPNHLVGQWAEAWITLYPTARILVADEKDMNSQHRQEFLARAAYNDWDAVIVSHSAFKLIPVDPEFYERFVQKELAQVNELLSQSDDLDKMTLKEFEKKARSLEERIKAMHERTNSKRDQGLLDFGEIGFDYVVNDESHMHKNVPYMTTLKNVSGLGNPAGSERAEDMFIKVSQAREAGAGVMFLTGTPISNTIAEMYLLMRYLGPEILEHQGIQSFDGWVSAFATVNEEFAFTLTGQFKSKKILSEFNDVPSLVQQYKHFADIIGQQDIDRLLKAEGQQGVPLPKIKGGKPRIVTCPMSPEQRRIVGEEVGTNPMGEPIFSEGSILHRLDNLPSKPEKGEDNILVIINDLKKVSLDARAFDPSAPAAETGKIPTCVQNIVDIYREWDADKGAQLVYLDFSTPKGARGKLSEEVRQILELVSIVEAGEDEEASDRAIAQAEIAAEKLAKYDPMEVEEAQRMARGQQVWSAYEEIRDQLIAQGIPEQEIAFIHDANTDVRKDELFGRVRSGSVRVLIGSTGKMGPGMNVQDRLVGIHHLDAPYRPSDVEQRNGRIIRQGNKLLEKYGKLEVDVMYYVTENSSDAGLWQILETKDKFINAIRFASGSRTVSDPDAQAMDPAAVKAMASGHELLMTEVPLRARLKNLQRLESAFKNETWIQRDMVKQAKNQIEKFTAEREERLQDVESALIALDQMDTRPKGGEKGTESRYDWDGALLSAGAINKTVSQQAEALFGYAATHRRELGNFEGFTFNIVRGFKLGEAYLEFGVTGRNTKYNGQDFAPKPGTDYVQRFRNLIRSVPDVVQRLEKRHHEHLETVASLSEVVNRPFDRYAEMAVVKEQHGIAETLLRLRVRKWAEIENTMVHHAITPDAVSKATDTSGLEKDDKGQFRDREALEERQRQATALLEAEARAKGREYVDQARVAFAQPPLTAQSIEILEHLGMSEADILALKEKHGLMEEVDEVVEDTPEPERPAEAPDRIVDTPEEADPELDPAAGQETVLEALEDAPESTQGTEVDSGRATAPEIVLEAPEPSPAMVDAPYRWQTFQPEPHRPVREKRPVPVMGHTMDLFADLSGVTVAPVGATPGPAAARRDTGAGANQADRAEQPMRMVPDILRPLMPQSQRSATEFGLRGPDHAFFESKMRELQSVIKTMPRSHDTDGQGDNAQVYLHYFTGSADWYITELDSDPDGEGQVQAFGLADLGIGFPELGYISLKELVHHDVELDYHFEPRTLLALKREKYPEMVQGVAVMPEKPVQRQGYVTLDPIARDMLNRVEASPYTLDYLLGDARARDVSDPLFEEDAEWEAARRQFADEIDAILNARIRQNGDALGELGWLQETLHGDFTRGDAVIHLESQMSSDGNLQGLIYRVSTAQDTEGRGTRSIPDYLRDTSARFADQLHQMAELAQTNRDMNTPDMVIPESLMAWTTAEQRQQWQDFWEAGGTGDRELMTAQWAKIEAWLQAPLPVSEAEKQRLDSRAGIVLRSENGELGESGHYWFISGMNADGIRGYGLHIHEDVATVGEVDLRVARLDAPLLVTNHESGPLRADLRDAQVLIESVNYEDDMRMMFYQGRHQNDFFEDGRFKTPGEMMDYRYEMQDDEWKVTEDGLTYQHIPRTASMMMVSDNAMDAARHGEVRTVIFNDPVFLHHKGYDSYLVGERQDLEAARLHLEAQAAQKDAAPEVQKPRLPEYEVVEAEIIPTRAGVWAVPTDDSKPAYLAGNGFIREVPPEADAIQPEASTGNAADNVRPLRPDQPITDQEDRWQKLRRLYRENAGEMDAIRQQIVDDYPKADHLQEVRELQERARAQKSAAIARVQNFKDTIVNSGIPNSDPSFRRAFDSVEGQAWLNASNQLGSVERQLIVLLRHEKLLDMGLAELWGSLAESTFDDVAKAGSWQAMQHPEYREDHADTLDAIIAARAGFLASALEASGWRWGGVSFTHPDYPALKLFPNAESHQGNNLSWGYRLTGPAGATDITDDFQQTAQGFVLETLTMALNTPMQPVASVEEAEKLQNDIIDRTDPQNADGDTREMTDMQEENIEGFMELDEEDLAEETDHADAPEGEDEDDEAFRPMTEAEAQQPLRDKPRIQMPDMFSTLNEIQIARTFSNTHGVPTNAIEFGWEHGQHKAGISIARTSMDEYTYALDIQSPTSGHAGHYHAWFSSLPEALQAARTAIVDQIYKQYQADIGFRHAGASQWPNLAEKVATIPEGQHRRIMAHDEEMIPHGRTELAALIERHQQEPNSHLLLQWGPWREKPEVTVELIADGTRMMARMRDTVQDKLLRESPVDPLHLDDWEAFLREGTQTLSLDRQRMVRNSPYGRGQQPALVFDGPLQHAPALLPAPQWPEKEANSELPREAGPFPMGNMDRYVTRTWADDQGNRVVFAIGHGPEGYVSQLGTQLGRSSTNMQPNVRQNPDSPRPVRSSFAEAYQDVIRAFRKTAKQERSWGGSSPAVMTLLDAVEGELQGHPTALVSARGGVDKALMADRNLESVRAVMLQLHLREGMPLSPHFAGNHQDEWLVMGEHADGEPLYLGAFSTWERAATAANVVMARLPGYQTTLANAGAAERNAAQSLSADQVPAQTAIAHEGDESAPNAVRVIRPSSLPVIAPVPVTEDVRDMAALGGVEGTYQGLDSTHSLICLDGQWYRHPLVDDWLQSGMFSRSGWDSPRDILGNASSWRGKSLILRPGISDGEVTKGEPLWAVRQDHQLTHHYESHLKERQQQYRMAMTDAEQIRDVGAVVVVDLLDGLHVQADFPETAQGALRLDVTYTEKSRALKAAWMGSDGRRVMDIQTDAQDARQPAQWAANARSHMTEWAEQARQALAAIDHLEKVYRQSAPALITALRAVSMASVEDRESLKAYTDQLVAIHAVFAQDVKQAQQAVPDTVDAQRMLTVAGGMSIRAWQDAARLLPELAQQATDQAKTESIRRGKELLEMLPDDPDAAVEDMAMAVFLKHGIETTEVPAIVPAIQHRDVDRIQSIIGHNSLNPASQEIFERMTGLQLGKTQKARMREIDQWAGITEEDRAQIDAQKKAARAQEKHQEKALSAWNDLGNVYTTGENHQRITAQVQILQWAEAGITRMERHPENAPSGKVREQPILVNPDTGASRYFHRNTTFNQLLNGLMDGGFSSAQDIREALRVSGLVEESDLSRTPEPEPVHYTPETTATAESPVDVVEPDVLPDPDFSGTDVRRILQQEFGITDVRHSGDGDRWSFAASIPEIGGEIDAYGTGASLDHVDLRDIPVKTPEALYPLLYRLDAAGLPTAALRSANILVDQSGDDLIRVVRSMVLTRDDIQRVMQLQGHKALDVVLTMVGSADDNADAIAAARQVLIQLNGRYGIPVAVKAFVDAADAEPDPETLFGLGADHVQVIAGPDIRKAPVTDWVRASDVVMVLGEPLVSTALSAVVDRRFSGDKKDLNKLTYVIDHTGQVEVHREAMLDIVARRIQYKAMDNARMDTQMRDLLDRQAEQAAATPESPTEQKRVVAEPLPNPVEAEQPPAPVHTDATESPVAQVSQEPQMTLLADAEAPAPDAQPAIEPEPEPEPAMVPAAVEAAALPVQEASPAQESLPVPDESEDTPVTSRDTAASPDTATAEDAAAFQVHQTQVMARLQAFDWSQMWDDLRGHLTPNGEMPDAAECCDYARLLLQERDPELWAEAIHFHFEVSDNPVQSPTIMQKGGHDILAFADRAVVDPWAGVHLPGKPYLFDFHDSKQLEYTEKLYGDPLRWDIVSLQVENQRGLSLPAATPEVSEDEILMALHRIQQSPQWPQIDSTDAERWLARAVEVASQEHQALQKMLDQGWIPVPEDHAESVLNRERLLFLVSHALYPSGSQMGDLLSTDGQERMLQRMRLQELPMRPTRDMLRGTLHEAAILAEVDRRHPGWTPVTQDYSADLETLLPEVMVHWDRVYRDTEGHYHVVDAKSPVSLPDAVDEDYVAQLHLYGEGLRRVLALQDSPEQSAPEIHLHIAYGVLAESLVKVVEVAHQPELAAHLIEKARLVTDCAVRGEALPQRPAEPLPEPLKAQMQHYLEQYETLKVQQDLMKESLEQLQDRIRTLQEGYAPEILTDAHGEKRVQTRLAAPTLTASNADAWTALATSAGVDASTCTLPEYDVPAMLDAVRAAGREVSDFQLREVPDISALRTAIKAAGGLPESTWEWKVGLSMTNAAKAYRDVLKEELRDRYAVEALPVSSDRAEVAKEVHGPQEIPSAAASVPPVADTAAVRDTTTRMSTIPARAEPSRSPRKP